MKKENNCSRLTSIGKSSSHPNDATISFKDLSSTTDPTSRGFRHQPSRLRSGVPYMMGRGSWAGIISLGVIHIAIFHSLHESILSMVQLQPGGFWFSSSGSKLNARAPAILKATNQGEGNETCYIHARLQGCKSCLTTQFLPGSEVGQRNHVTKTICFCQAQFF